MEGGGQKTRKFCGRLLWMSPNQDLSASQPYHVQCNVTPETFAFWGASSTPSMDSRHCGLVWAGSGHMHAAWRGAERSSKTSKASGLFCAAARAPARSRSAVRVSYIRGN